MNVTLLGTGDDGTSPCVLIEAGGRRLLLNATEGLQRLSFDRGLRIHRDLDAVLLSSLDPAATAGLAGLLLTMADAGVACLRVFGPPGTAQLLRSLLPFIRREPQLLPFELSADEALEWIGGLRIFVLPVAASGACEEQSRLARQWIAARGHPTVDESDGGPPLAKRARTVHHGTSMSNGIKTVSSTCGNSGVSGGGSGGDANSSESDGSGSGSGEDDSTAPGGSHETESSDDGESSESSSDDSSESGGSGESSDESEEQPLLVPAVVRPPQPRPPSSEERGNEPLTLRRLPWAVEPPSESGPSEIASGPSEIASSLPSRFSFLCVPAAGKVAGTAGGAAAGRQEGGALLLCCCADEAELASLRSHGLLTPGASSARKGAANAEPRPAVAARPAGGPSGQPCGDRDQTVGDSNLPVEDDDLPCALGWVVHAVPSALAARPAYRNWIRSLMGSTALPPRSSRQASRHVLLCTDPIPRESFLAFGACSAQSVTLGLVAGELISIPISVPIPIPIPILIPMPIPIAIPMPIPMPTPMPAPNPDPTRS